eukprot:CAMPEP_0177636346 /NCGR_PEP_ID=MMETSP0447-20121125/4390_1 /TAXON_ID=0 /ORGANISM="Stygamoeba regulata, Strain BSH-02190019" /LENGTH=309 /DNA_ID=CAMNT_0019138203 /DNA_START=142 /DNA_END=1071 /DNA_ORIENTATION=+
MANIPQHLLVDPLGVGEDAFLCGICGSVLADPVCCQDGHSICRPCAEEARANKKGCTVEGCACPLDVLVPNRALRKLIGSRLVRCPNSTDRDVCEWVGPLNTLPLHSEECPLACVPCPYTALGCAVRVRRNEVAHHLADVQAQGLASRLQRVKRKASEITRSTCLVFEGEVVWPLSARQLADLLSGAARDLQSDPVVLPGTSTTVSVGVHLDKSSMGIMDSVCLALNRAPLGSALAVGGSSFRLLKGSSGCLLLEKSLPADAEIATDAHGATLTMNIVKSELRSLSSLRVVAKYRVRVNSLLGVDWLDS